jgi:diguanylate cyclase (GGDEF)-like protein/PAS domain S-box-containing protein
MTATETLHDSPLASLSSTKPETLAGATETQSLDCLREPVFEHLEAIARALFFVRTARILTLEQHQGLLQQVTRPHARASFGTPSAAERRQSTKPTVVLDTLDQDRWAGTALLRRWPPVRFYAEATLRDFTGTPIGVLCLLGDVAKAEFTADERALLMRLATLAGTAIEQREFRRHAAELEQALLEANELYTLVTRATSDGIWDWERSSGKILLSARLRAMLGLPQKDARESVSAWLARTHPGDLEEVRREMALLQESDKPGFECEYRVRHEDGSWRWLHSRAIATRDAAGQLCRLTGSCVDVTAARSGDQLTGLHSRLFLLNALDERLRENREEQIALLVIDLNQFKRVNDSFGHSVGDLLLIQAARRIQLTLGLRTGDMAARIVGDEFAVLLSHIHSETEAIEYAARLHASIAMPAPCTEQEVKLSASIGIAFGPSGYTSPEQMLHDAETAMHQAKAREDPQTALFCPAIRQRALERMSLGAELRNALLADKVAIHYQPKVRLATGELVGFESLMRWPHPKRGFVPPEEFIALAEESDLILDIGRWTLCESIRQLAAWRAEGLVPPATTVAVNLSALQFADEHLIENLLRKLRMHNLPAQCLELEVTEGILISDIARAQRVLRELKAIDVGLDLDDFGTGYSSLKYLQSFPFASLKVDRSFVAELGTQAEATTIAHSIVTLGRALKLDVIAEGVETPEQAEMLRSMGCEYGQGYLYSKPLPPEEMRALLAGRLARHGSIRLPRIEADALTSSAA